MQSQFIDRRTRSDGTVAVDVGERGGAVRADVYAVERVRGSGPFHELRLPGVLDVDELAIGDYEVRVACGRYKT